MASFNGSLAPETREFYRRAMRLLHEADVPFLVGGAYALAPLTGIERHTKDLDLFLRPIDRDRALDLFESAGYPTEITAPHWLAKAYAAPGEGQPFVDLIYRSGNGLVEVDDHWFAHAAEGVVLGVRARLTPPEESLWSKAFIMERERFDGADVAHLIRSLGPRLDWERLVQRFGAEHWRLLLAHVALFGYIFPSERDKVPAWVVHELNARLRAEADTPAPADAVCRGTLLSRAQYLADVADDLADARLEPRGSMTPDDVELWTEAIARDGPGATPNHTLASTRDARS